MNSQFKPATGYKERLFESFNRQGALNMWT